MATAIKLNTNYRGRKKSPKKIVNLFSYKTPNIIIVGHKSIRKKLQKIESNFDIILVFTKFDEIRYAINDNTLAIIIDENEVQLKVSAHISTTLKKYPSIPTYLLSRKNRSTNFYSNLYARGLMAAIRWPQEASTLHDFLIESFRPHPKAVGNNKGDIKLAKVIKSHLILSGGHKNIKVTVIEGFVFIDGIVKTLLDKKQVEQDCSKVLGVKKVISKNLKIRAYPKISDRELERNIKLYINNLASADRKTLLTNVKNKIVNLSGLCSDYQSLQDIESFIIRQKGVQKLLREVKYRPSMVAKNAQKAKLLESKLMALFQGVKHISIKIYGDYAEVSGVVKISASRALVENYLLQVLPVKKIINKLYLT